jgi:hypothetical protein
MSGGSLLGGSNGILHLPSLRRSLLSGLSLVLLVVSLLSDFLDTKVRRKSPYVLSEQCTMDVVAMDLLSTLREFPGHGLREEMIHGYVVL